VTSQEVTTLILATESALYLLLCFAALRRSGPGKRDGRALVLYTALSCLWVVEQLAWHVGWLNSLGTNVFVLVRVASYGLVLLALLFLYLTRTFLRLPGAGWPWVCLGLAWIAALILLDSSVVALPTVLELPGGWSLGRVGLTFGLTVAGWATLLIAALVLTLRTLRHSQLPLHRNRMTYWLAAWASTLAGDLLFFAGYEVIGGDVRLLGTVVAIYVVLTHRLPDVRTTARRTLSYLIITLLTIAIYTAGFTAAQYFFQDVPGYSPLWAGAAVALVLAVLFDPLLRLIHRLVDRLIGGARYDPSRMVSEYSLRISNIVSLTRLASVAIEVINDALKIQSGMMFTIHHEREQGRGDVYRLRGIKGADGIEPPPGALSAVSPATHHLRDERHPLLQYDIDLHPDFREMAESERAWLSALGVDVYIPIHAQGSWIGLLALGSKLSGDRYFDQDLALLNTLADQTAVALENARLVDDLIEINNDLEEAYATLEQANRRLQEMDRLKSAFIGVITHELRSPFANIAFSLQLFQRYGLENLTPEQREQFEQLLSNLKQAKAMVDNLVSFATFLAKQGELDLAEVDFRQVIQDTLLPLRPLIESKSFHLRVLVPDALPPVHADRDRLADAVHHLVHNAIKFTPAGGEIWLRCQATDAALLFEVKDTGIGIPADKLPTLWEEFAQVADPLRRGVEGLGLGLALVKYIVNAHGGRVWAESQEGAGSKFGFEIPLAGPGSQNG
jgi:signal transduction histidine kinase